MLISASAIPPIINIGTIYFIVLGIVILILSGILSDSYNDGTSLIISTFSIVIPLFLLINALTDINTMRMVVGILVFTGIIPYTITYLILWVLSHRRTNIVRILYTSFIGWWLSLIFIGVTRLIAGWGDYNSFITILIVILLYTLFTGIIGSIFGKIILEILSKYRPVKKSIY